MKILYSAVLCCLFLTLCPPAFAETLVTGIASVNYKSGFFSSKVDKETKDDAFQKALLNAWKKHTCSFSAAKYKEYSKIEKDFTAHLDQYIADASITDEKINSDTKIYTVAVKVLIRDVAVKNKLSMTSEAGNTASGDGSMFSFIFVARDVTKIKSYDDKINNVKNSNAISTIKEMGAMDGDEMIESRSRESFSNTSHGGSVEKKADKVSYTISNAADIDKAMNEILSPAGFEVVKYADIVGECGGPDHAVIKKDFSSLAELSWSVRRAAIAGARKCDVPLFAIGTLDAGMAHIDPVSGLKRVYVSVNAEVNNIEKRLPKRVASIGPVQFSGVGPTKFVAKRNALSKAAKKAARSIVDQLNAKGIK